MYKTPPGGGEGGLLPAQGLLIYGPYVCRLFNGTGIAFGRYIKQGGWGNSPPNPTDGKLMHIYF